jgi:hypothetical protein
MNKITQSGLESLVEAFDRLPEYTHADVMAALEATFQTFETSNLTSRQRDVVKSRLASTRRYADQNDVDRVLSRFTPPK